MRLPVPPGHIAEIVTYLEMTVNPSPPPSTGDIRRVDLPGPGWYLDLYRRIGEPWLWSSRLRMDPAELLNHIHHPDVSIFALRHSGSDEGLLELDRRVPSEVEIKFFGLTPSITGRGAGRDLMNFALAEAWRPGPRRVWLHTCTHDHPRALEFYLRSGFTAFRREVEVSEDPRVAGIYPPGTAPHIPLIR
jgi:GNAT superfamily N-acetyltransferase